VLRQLFEPGFSPATTKLVLLETEPGHLPAICHNLCFGLNHGSCRRAVPVQEQKFCQTSLLEAKVFLTDCTLTHFCKRAINCLLLSFRKPGMKRSRYNIPDSIYRNKFFKSGIHHIFPTCQNAKQHHAQSLHRLAE